MKKSEILKLLGILVKSYNVTDYLEEKWLETEVYGLSSDRFDVLKEFILSIHPTGNGTMNISYNNKVIID